MHYQQAPSARFITWSQLNGFLPFVGLLVTIISSYFLLQNRMSLVEQKLQEIADTQQQILTLHTSVQATQQHQALQIQQLDIVNNIAYRTN